MTRNFIRCFSGLLGPRQGIAGALALLVLAGCTSVLTATAIIEITAGIAIPVPC